MVRILTTTLAVAALLMLVPQARAVDGHRSYRAHRNHQRHHDDLGHRAYHRDLEHREAHRYPMNWRQHGRLHDGLDHDAYHDRLEHRGAHRSGAYYPRYRGNYSRQWGYAPRGGVYYQPGRSFGYYSPGFSLRFGR